MYYKKLESIGKQFLEIQEAIKPITEASYKITKAIEPMIINAGKLSQASQYISKSLEPPTLSVTPIVKYLNSNAYKITNLVESIESMYNDPDIAEYLTSDNLAVNLDSLEQKDIIHTTDNWTIEKVSTEQVVDKTEPTMTISDKIALANMIISILITLINMSSIDVEFNIDKSTTITEKHYHIHSSTSEQENIITLNIDRVDVYEDSSKDAPIINTIDSNIELIKVVSENGYTLVVGKDEYKLTGWIKNEYIETVE